MWVKSPLVTFIHIRIKKLWAKRAAFAAVRE